MRGALSASQGGRVFRVQSALARPSPTTQATQRFLQPCVAPRPARRRRRGRPLVDSAGPTPKRRADHCGQHRGGQRRCAEQRPKPIRRDVRLRAERRARRRGRVDLGRWRDSLDAQRRRRGRGAQSRRRRVLAWDERGLRLSPGGEQRESDARRRSLSFRRRSHSRRPAVSRHGLAPRGRRRRLGGEQEGRRGLGQAKASGWPALRSAM